MSLAALIVSVVALVVSAIGLLYSRRSASSAIRSTAAAEAAERRARMPQLSITLGMTGPKDDRVIYTIRNDGPQDLDEVRVYRPRPDDNITYPVAVTGADWALDDIEVGPLALTQEARFTLSCGSADALPEFRVRIECAAGDDRWTLTKLLADPRPPRAPRVR